MSPHQTITMSDLPVGIQNANPEEQGIKVFMTGEGISLKQAREDFEKEFILQKLQENEGNISRTAEAIDMERSNLHRKIKSYGIDAKK